MGEFTFYVVLIAAGVIVALIATIIGVTVVNKNEDKERCADLRKRLETFSQNIRDMAQQHLGASTGNGCQDFQALCKNARQKYIHELNTRHITETQYSWSDLGLCGVSSTHFWYNLSASNHSITYSETDWHALFNEKADWKQVQQLCEHVDNRNATPSDVVVMKQLEERLDFWNTLERGEFKPYWISIARKDISFYRLEGGVQYASNVHGGGVNIDGAVAGAMIAGSAGAVIGSNIGTEIKTTIEKKDNRKITLFYSNSMGAKSMEIKSSDYDKTLSMLRKLIPEKEEGMAQMNAVKATQLHKAEAPKLKAQNDASIPEQIKQYKELLDMQAITQEEFDAKKKQLLGL